MFGNVPKGKYSTHYKGQICRFPINSQFPKSIQFTKLQNTAFPLVKSRLALGFPGCLFSGHHAEMAQENVIKPMSITFSRPDHQNKII